MIRRRRPTREIPFSFDSFLDVVANVVGIIIRLILVTWVGARAYTGFVLPPPPPAAPVAVAEEDAPLPEPEDPLAPEIERQKQEMALAQARLLAQVRQWEQAHDQHALTAKELDAVRGRMRSLAEESGGLERGAGERGKAEQTLALSLSEIRARGKKLADELEALRKAPPAKQTFRYRTPVSQPLQTEEVMFECRRGKTTLLDIGALQDEVSRTLRDKGEQLRTRWEVTDVTPPVGAFRLRYTVERERGPADGSALPPGSRDNFQYGMTGWEAEPVAAERGETAGQALAGGSAFRRVIDGLDVNQTAVTFWVYPDSFAAYRRLRDYLHERDVTVAGRPLPEGVAIQARRDGSASRGQ